MGSAPSSSTTSSSTRATSTSTAKDAGYALNVALSEAIERVAARADGPTQDGFAYRGTSLRFAVERDLSVRLSNNASFEAAFRAIHAGSSPAPVEVATELEADVVRQALATDCDLVVASTAGRRLKRLAWPVAAAHGRRRQQRFPESARGRTLLALDYLKFFRFVQPVIEQMHGEVAIAAADRALVERLSGGTIPYVEFDYGWPVASPRERDMGPALREYRHVAAELDRFVQALEDAQPRAVVVVEGNNVYDEIANRACKLKRTPCVCLQQGWAPFTVTGLRNMSFTSMALWGEGFAELLREHNPAQPFEITGSPLFAASPTGPAIPGAPTRIGFFMQARTQLMSAEHVAALNELAVQVADRLPDATVLVREHPGHPLPGDTMRALTRPNVAFVNPGDYPLRPVLEACDVVVSMLSTTLIEAAAMGKPPVIFNPTSLPRMSPDLASMGAGLETEDPREAADAIVALATVPARRAALDAGMKAVRERFFANGTPDAVTRIAALIDSLAAHAEMSSEKTTR